jgi:hypothetical protein
MKLTINLNDKMDILEAITMLRNLAGLENGTPAPAPVKEAVQQPKTEKKEKLFKTPAERAAETPAVEDPVDPGQDQPDVAVPPAAADRPKPANPVMKEVTIPDIQAVIREHLKKFAPGSRELMDERNNMIEVLRDSAGVGSSADIPDDRLSDTFIAITTYVNGGING